MNRMEIKVCSYYIRAGIISRMLYRSKVRYIMILRNNNHTAWMLACSAFYTHTTLF